MSLQVVQAQSVWAYVCVCVCVCLWRIWCTGYLHNNASVFLHMYELCEYSVRNKNPKYLQVIQAQSVCVHVCLAHVRVALWLRRLTSNQKIAGSDPLVVEFLFKYIFLILLFNYPTKLSRDNIFVYCNNDEWV